MSTLADRVVLTLTADVTLTTLATGGVFPEDIRLAGPQAYPQTRQGGFWKPSVCVDDAGGVAAPLGPSGSYADRLVVWVFGESSDRRVIDQIAQRVIALLHRWQDSTTKALTVYASRTGYQPDPAPATGALDSITFGINGISLGIRS